MKVYISFDIEGVAGIVDIPDYDEKSPEFFRARKLATDEVNAAVEGALAGGATEVVIYDGHGFHRRNLLFEELHPQAKLIRSRLTTPGYNMPTFDASYAAVFFIGWHARPSSPGLLSHCYNPEVFTAWRVNGIPVGEPEFSAALAGHFGVPVVLFTGDDCACAEVAAWNPSCERVVTKQALDRFAGILYSPEITLPQIRSASERALHRRSEIPPFTFTAPFRVEADTIFDHHAAALTIIPGVEQTAPRSVAFESHSYTEVFRALQAMTVISIFAH